MDTDTHVVNVDVGSGWDKPAPQMVFEQLLKLGMPIIERYQSDLYHDAIYLEKWLDGAFEFYWGCDEYGTAIGTDLELVKISRKNIWRVEVYDDTPDGYSRHWKVDLEQIR